MFLRTTIRNGRNNSFRPYNSIFNQQQQRRQQVKGLSLSINRNRRKAFERQFSTASQAKSTTTINNKKKNYVYGFSLFGLVMGGLFGGQSQLEGKEQHSSVTCLMDQPGYAKITKRLFREIRDRESSQNRFVYFTDRLLELTMEVALGELEHVSKQVVTPTGEKFTGLEFSSTVAAVSILRSGDALMNAFKKSVPGAPTGKLLLVKHDESEDMKILYSKLPKNLDQCQVLLLDPMLATGGTMKKAINVLVKEHNVKPSKITVVSLIACPAGINKVHKSFPGVKIVTAAIDPGLDENRFVAPGLGSFGDRYFGTN